MLEPFLAQLAQDLELEEAPRKDKNQQYVFALNAEQMIVFQEIEAGILLRARIAAFAQEKQEELCLKVMKGNFLGQGTGRAIIGLESSEKFLTLSCILPYDLNYKLFKQALEEFANYLSYWQEELAADSNGTEFPKI